MPEAVMKSQKTDRERERDGGGGWYSNGYCNTNNRQHSLGAIRVCVMENCTDSVKLR